MARQQVVCRLAAGSGPLSPFYCVVIQVADAQRRRTSAALTQVQVVWRSWSNAEIAERLYLSPATARTHVGRLLTKIQARDRTQLVVIAHETGLVTPSGA